MGLNKKKSSGRPKNKKRKLPDASDLTREQFEWYYDNFKNKKISENNSDKYKIIKDKLKENDSKILRNLKNLLIKFFYVKF